MNLGIQHLGDIQTINKKLMAWEIKKSYTFYFKVQKV